MDIFQPFLMSCTRLPLSARCQFLLLACCALMLTDLGATATQSPPARDNQVDLNFLEEDLDDALDEDESEDTDTAIPDTVDTKIDATPPTTPAPQTADMQTVDVDNATAPQPKQKAPAQSDSDNEPVAMATLRVLDKITARSKQIQVPIGEMAAFGRLRIVVNACATNKPTEPPEATAFLQVFEELPDRPGNSETHFSGWMFRSSPTLSALNHPIYDVWVERCNQPKERASTHQAKTEHP